MQTIDILQEIRRLPFTKKFYVVEETIKSIKNDEMNQRMVQAVNELYADYKTDAELTVFTELDLEDFYEAKWNLANWFRPYEGCGNLKEASRCHRQ